MALFKILRGNDSSKLVKSDGSINTQVKWNDGYAYFCTDTHDFYIDHLDSSGKQVRSKLNSKEADKLRTSRSISLGDAVTSTATYFDGSANITIPVNSVKEAYLTWGGKSTSGGIGPLAASLSSEHSANRLAYINPDALFFERSSDGGNTWTEVTSISNANKTSFVVGSIGIPIGQDTFSTSHQMRCTITAQNSENVNYLYTRAKKMLIEVGVGSHQVYVTVEKKQGKTSATWEEVCIQKISGHTGWNEIDLGSIYFGGGTSQTSNYWQLRLTFSITQISGTTAPYIRALRLFGDSYWTVHSNMAKTGHLYAYDTSQNATFPAKVTATALASTGTLAVTGNSTLTGNLTVNGKTILGDQYNDTILSKGVTTIGDSARTYATAQLHTLYGNLEMYKGYFYVESEDGASYFAVDGDPNGEYTEVNSMPLKLTGRGATLNVDGVSQFNQTVTIGNSNDYDNVNCLLDVYGEIDSNSLHIYGGAIIDSDIETGGVLYVNGVNGGVNSIEAVGGIYSQDSLSTGGMLYVGNEANLNIVNVTGILSSTNEIYTTGSIIYAITSDGNHGAMLDATGYAYATDYMEAPEFIGDLTGTADEAISLTWAYFNDSGVIS